MFSKTENDVILVMLGVKKKHKIAISEIAKARPFRKSFDSKAKVASAIRRINKKCLYFDLPWFIDGEGLGRGGRSVWRANRKTRSKKKS